jgi:hypothetical protein
MNERRQELFEEAARLFSENENMFGDLRQDREKANLYRGLAALAEGLAQLQRQMQQEHHETENRITPGRHPASVRRR